MCIKIPKYYKEIDCSNLPKLNPYDNLIITSWPTEDDVIKAKEEDKTVLAFIKVSKNVGDRKTLNEFVEKYYLWDNCIHYFIVPNLIYKDSGKKMKISSYIKLQVKYLIDEINENPWIPPAGLTRGMLLERSNNV